MKIAAKVWEICVLLSAVFIPSSEGQSEILNATLSESTIYSPGYFDGAYENNLFYDYLITTWYADHTILLSVVFCDIENLTTSCADWLKIYDGSNNSANVLLDTYCCQTDKLPVIQTTGSTVYIVFQTDKDIKREGFKLSYISDGPIPVDPTDTSSNESSIWERYKWIIVGSAYGGLNVVGAIITLCCVLKKKEVIDVKEPDLINAT